MRHGFFVLIILAGLVGCDCQTSGSLFSLKGVSEGPVLVKVNGFEIHEGLLDTIAQNSPLVKARLSNPLHRKRVLDSLVDQLILYQEALRQGLDKSDKVVFQTMLNRHMIIANSLVEAKLTEEMKKVYQERKSDQFTKINVSLIAAHFNKDAKDKKQNKDKDSQPTAAEKKAALDRINKIKERLDKGESFAKLAKEESDDKMTRKKGGQAGQISKNDKRFARLGLGELVKEAFQLKKGEVSGPIETKKGYYLVKVTSDPIVVPFETAERVLRFELQNKIKKELIESLRARANIQFMTTNQQKEESTNKEGT